MSNSKNLGQARGRVLRCLIGIFGADLAHKVRVALRYTIGPMPDQLRNTELSGTPGGAIKAQDVVLYEGNVDPRMVCQQHEVDAYTLLT